MDVRIRLLQADDLAKVVALQDHCYSDDLYEPPALLGARLKVAAESCWMAENTAGELLGYLFSYPALTQHVTVLASQFERAAAADLLYLHDLAVSEAARGKGIAAILLKQAEQHAAALSLPCLALVAVQKSQRFWHKQGFIAHRLIAEKAQCALHSYGLDAVYMQKPLTSG